METLLERIKNLLATKDVEAEADGDDELMFQARTGPISVRMRISVRKEAVLVVAHIPLFVPEHRRSPIFEAIARANFQLRFARFEIDPSDGELRCRADMPLYDGIPSDEQLNHLLYSVWSDTERYATGLVEVLTGQTEPAIAMARAEALELQSARRRVATDLTVN